MDGFGWCDNPRVALGGQEGVQMICQHAPEGNFARSISQMGLWSRVFGRGGSHLVLFGVKCGMGVEWEPLGGEMTGVFLVESLLGGLWGFANGQQLLPTSHIVHRYAQVVT